MSVAVSILLVEAIVDEGVSVVETDALSAVKFETGFFDPEAEATGIVDDDCKDDLADVTGVLRCLLVTEEAARRVALRWIVAAVDGDEVEEEGGFRAEVERPTET